MAQNQGHQGRRINPAELGIDLLLNFLEQYSDDMGKLGWGTPAVLGGFGIGARQALRDFLSSNPSALPFLETGVKGLVFAAAPNMGPETKLAMNALFDMYTDKVRRTLTENDDKAEAQIGVASGAFQAEFRKIMEDAKKKAAAKKPWHVIEAEWGDQVAATNAAKRKELDAWVKDMRLHSRTEFGRWEALKHKIDKTERLVYLMSLPAEDRIAHLEMAYGTPPSVMETVQAIARGETTSETVAWSARVQAATADMEQRTTVWKTESEAIRRRNKGQGPVAGQGRWGRFVVGCKRFWRSLSA